MAGRGSLRGGDLLAKGASKAQFSAGGSKVGEKVQINPGIMTTDADATSSQKEKLAFSKKMSAEQQQRQELQSKITPLYDRVFVKQEAEEAKSQGGIILPDDSKDKPCEGTIISVGFGRLLQDGKLAPMYVKEGQRVLFGKYAGTEVKVDGVSMLMMREDEILAIIGCPNA